MFKISMPCKSVKHTPLLDILWSYIIILRNTTWSCYCFSLLNSDVLLRSLEEAFIKCPVLYMYYIDIDSKQGKTVAPCNPLTQFLTQTLNNTKPNGHKNAHFSKISVPGVICAIKIGETALYSLKGPLESN